MYKILDITPLQNAAFDTHFFINFLNSTAINWFLIVYSLYKHYFKNASIDFVHLSFSFSQSDSWPAVS
jgi:hypothetical protein